MLSLLMPVEVHLAVSLTPYHLLQVQVPYWAVERIVRMPVVMRARVEPVPGLRRASGRDYEPKRTLWSAARKMRKLALMDSRQRRKST